MKLLLDHNLSYRLTQLLADVFPGSSQLTLVQLDRAPDPVVRRYAAAGGYAIVTKDADYPRLAATHGIPPKVVWLRIGDCSTAQAEAAIRAHTVALLAFDADPAERVYVIP